MNMVDAILFVIALVFMPGLIWWNWCRPIWSVRQQTSTHRERTTLYVTPFVALLVLLVVLFDEKAASPARWTGAMLWCFIQGAVLVALSAYAVPLAGLIARDDVAERCNYGAGWAIGGSILGSTLAFAIPARNSLLIPGDAPAALPGLLSMTLYFLLWLGLEFSTGFSEEVTVDRDGGAALRLTGILPLLGASVGIAMAKLIARRTDFAFALYTVLAVLVLACSLLERWFARDPRPVSMPSLRDILYALCCSFLTVVEILLSR